MIDVILKKELLELRRSPVLLLSMVSLPLTVVAVPVALLAWLVHAAPEQALVFVQDVYGDRAPGGAMAGVAASLARNWLPMFLVLPIFLPILLAAQSIGGERERRTLEPLLATPVATSSIILGKSLAALLPALATPARRDGPARSSIRRRARCRRPGHRGRRACAAWWSCRRRSARAGRRPRRARP